MFKQLEYRIFQAFGYQGERTFYHYTQRICGLWLIYIGVLIMLASVLGGELYIHPVIFGAGFFIGYLFIWGFPYLNRKLATGEPTDFQKRMDNFGLFINIMLCSLCALLIGTSDLRFLWLVILLIVGFHFLPFFYSQGKWLIYLALFTILNAMLGLIFSQLQFILFGIVDGIIKLTIGIKMLYFMTENEKSSTIDKKSYAHYKW